MKLHSIGLYLFLLPAVTHADFAIQQHNILIKAAAYQPDESVIEYTGSYRVNIKGRDFVSKSFKPIWIEISNDSDQCIKVSAQPVPDHVLIEKSVLLKKFKNGWGAWTVLFGLTIAPYIDLEYLYYYLKAKLKRETLSGYWHWDPFRMDLTSRLLFAGMAFMAGCGAYGYNKTLEAGIHISLLEGQCLIMPGGKIRKFVVLDTADQFILNIAHSGTDQTVQRIEVQI